MTASSIMSAFPGEVVPADVARRLAHEPVAGFTLFRQHNVRSAAQVRELTASLQAAAPESARPLLVASDQEGGQLIALGDDTTQFAGAMALGAVGDADLAERVARAIGRELRALGVNVNYWPVCDLATHPGNRALGTRSFGDDPAAVPELVAATVRGLQAEGVAATAKHFPGAGESRIDTHYGLATVSRERAGLEGRELVPFRAAMKAGARLVMSGHFAVPALTGDETLPATLAEPVMTGLLRRELGFEGVAITDALDMHALGQGAAQVVDVVTAVRAGVDLLLGTADAEALERVEVGLAQALLRGLVAAVAVERSAHRVAQLRGWLAGYEQPPLEVVACAEHAALAREVAERSITLVRDDARLLPLRPGADERILVVQPRPADLTLAETSSYVRPLLADAIRQWHAATDELVVDQRPSAAEIASIVERALDAAIVVVGTVSADLQPEQSALVGRLLSTGRPTVTLALRTPWDLATYPAASTHVCAYGILPLTMQATAAALFGQISFRGRLPVTLAGLYPSGHGITTPT